ncbi:MAG: hypothetical protein QXT26_06595 [Thermoproteota archaeon]
MKRTLSITTIGALVIAISTLSAPPSRQAQLTLTAAYPYSLNIIVTPTDEAYSLDLETGANQVKVADVIEKCNWPRGYEVWAYSQNGGLKHESGQQVVPYVMYYGDVIDVPSEDMGQESQLLVNAPNTRGTVSREIKVTIDPQSNIPEGDYTDTITFTIVAKN